MDSFNAAQKYDSNSLGQREVGLELMRLLAPEKGSTVLDIGCGTGYLTKALADLVGPEGKVVGTDTNAERLEIAREKYSASNIQYLEGSAEDIPKLADIDSYDVIFSNFVLHRCANKERVFQEVYRVLKKGGKFGFVAGTDLELAEVQFTPEIVSSEYLAAAQERVLLVTMEEYMHHASDFEIEQAKESIYEWRFPDVHKYIDMLYMHAHGDFDMSHFSVEAAREHFGEGEITFGLPFGTFIACKQY